jgi:hypothetical protein
MRFIRRVIGCVLFVSTVGFFTTAHAATFTQDKTAFDAATSSLSFSSNDFSTFRPVSNSWDYDDFVVSSTRNIVARGGGSCRVSCLQIERNITFSFDEPVTAVGFYILHLVAGSTDVLVDDVKVGEASWGNPNYFFFGVYDLTTPFTTISMPGDRFFFYLDDLSWSVAPDSPTPVPLPAGMLLLLSGLFGLGTYKFRK